MAENIKFSFIFVLAIILFIYNAFKFLGTNGSDLPIPTILFELIILLSLIVFSLHENDIKKNSIQTKIEDYIFKKK